MGTTRTTTSTKAKAKATTKAKAPTQLATAKAKAKANGLAWGKLTRQRQAAYLAHANPARDQKAAAAKAVGTGKANRTKAIAAALLAASNGKPLTKAQATNKAKRLA